MKAKSHSNPLHFFTIVAKNYLSYALVLGESVVRHHPDAAFSIFLMDDPEHVLRSKIEDRGFSTIYPEEIPLQDYRKFVFKYNITEASTGVKPFVFCALLERGAQKIVYLDPDILCFRRFAEVIDALNTSSIVLTPHLCSPVPDDIFPGERSALRSGVFNLGFIAIRKDNNASSFIQWWSDHLMLECVAEPDAGLFVDQKWIDLVPSLFDNVFILRNLGYNIAYWNLHERFLEMRGETLFEAYSGAPVTFFHFSGLPLDDINSICKYRAKNPFEKGVSLKRFTLTTRPDLAGLFRMYHQLLLKADVLALSKSPYSYAAYENGELISQLERSIYLGSPAWLSSPSDPFAVGKKSFHNACRKGGVRSARREEAIGSPNAQLNHYGPYRRMIEQLVRYCLRMLGPEKYLAFAKYMRHQFLPMNHAFLLRGKQPVESIPGTNVVGENLSQTYEKSACEGSKV